ncbi:hypothetical protein FKM82_023612 [Ascaphus truei]
MQDINPGNITPRVQFRPFNRCWENMIFNTEDAGLWILLLKTVHQGFPVPVFHWENNFIDVIEENKLTSVHVSIDTII